MGQKAIQNKIMAIYGLPGSGKTILAMFLQSFYNRVYSNVDFIRYSDDQKVIQRSIHINHMRDLHAIKYNDIKGLAVLDEGGINISSRRSLTEENMQFLELGMLGRKKNIDIIVISQLERSIDVVMRELCKASFNMREFWEDKRLKFEATVYGRNEELKAILTFDLIKFGELTGWTYDTKEESIIKNDRSDKHKKVSDNINELRAILEV